MTQQTKLLQDIGPIGKFVPFNHLGHEGITGGGFWEERENNNAPLISDPVGLGEDVLGQIPNDKRSVWNVDEIRNEE